VKKKNVYMGIERSVAGIPTHGKVNEDWEILANIYATAYDEINGQLLTRIPHKYDKATIKEIKSRFRVLKLLAKKYAPHLLDEIQYIEKLTLANAQGRISDREFLERLRSYIISRGLDPKLVALIELKINQAEGYDNLKSGRAKPPGVAIPMGVAMRPKKSRNKKKTFSPFDVIKSVFG